jgi:hypothetical protein
MQPEQTKGLPRSKKWLIYLIFFAVVGTLIFGLLPRGSYSTDLTRIGGGRPALVLAYDINSMGAMEVMKLMDALRDEYSDRVEFLVADLGTPDGYKFTQRHDGINGTVMFYSGEGSHVRTMHLPPNTETLRLGLEEAISAQP